MRLTQCNGHGIRVYDEVLPSRFCQTAIEAFHASQDTQESRTTAGVEIKLRQGRTLFLRSPEFDALKEEFTRLTREVVHDYARDQRGLLAILAHIVEQGSVRLSTPRIERIDVGQGFDWHIDAGPGKRDRCLAIVSYLNAVEDGGHTDFKCQDIHVAPVEGRMLVFPPYWTHPHRGSAPVSNPKYTLAAFVNLVERRQPSVAGSSNQGESS